MINSIADVAAGQTFDGFLDHSESYLKNNNKNEAGVIAGIVFEDTVRRICRKNSIDEQGRKLDELISALAKNEIITSNGAKRARSAAGVRTSAAHAQWDEFQREDVRPVIDFTRELIGQHLDG